MSAETFAGDGLSDQPSLIYSYDDGNKIREISRSGHAEPGKSPGEIIKRSSTKSSPNDRLPQLSLPARDDPKPSCGDDIPAFACGDCGNPVYVGNTCASPRCHRCWAAAVKDKTTRLAGKLEGLRRKLYARYRGKKDIDFNHVVASLPDFAVDSDEPVERALLILKTLLEDQFDIAGFAAIYHPYRIKKEYRADQYEHGGEEGDGDMTWKDVLDSDRTDELIKFEPHFHLFFPAVRRSFDYSVCEYIENESGWLLHRITKSGDSNVSVSDLDDLIHQITYCFSHAGVNDWRADRSELTSRMKGELHNCYIPDGVENKCLSAFCEAAPRLLGVTFTNVESSTCDAEISTQPKGDDTECTDDHPVSDLYSDEQPITSSAASLSFPGENTATAETTFAAESTSSSATSTSLPVASDDGDTCTETTDSPMVDNRQRCGGNLLSMAEAKQLLEDQDWCRNAEYAAGLRRAVKEFERLSDEADKPWDNGDNDDLNDSHNVVRGL